MILSSLLLPEVDFNLPILKLVLVEIWGYLQRNTASLPHKYMWIRNMIIGMMIFSILPFSEVKFDLRFQRYAILKYESICREIQCWNLTNTCELEIWPSWWWCWTVCFCQNSISSSQFNVSQITNLGISRKKYSAKIHVNDKYDHLDDDDDDDDDAKSEGTLPYLSKNSTLYVQSCQQWRQ